MKRIIAAILLFTATAQAQTLGPCEQLLAVSNVTATNATPTGKAISALGPHYIVTGVVTEDSGTSTLDIALEHSPSCDGTFVPLKDINGLQISFSQFSATDALATVKGQASFLPCVRAPYTITGTGQWDITVRLCVER